MSEGATLLYTSELHYLRKNIDSTLPGLVELCRTEYNQEFRGLESVHMEALKSECSALEFNRVEPECVTGNSDGHHTTSSVKSDPDLGPTHTGDHIKTEHLDCTERQYSRLHPSQIKTETDALNYIKAEQNSHLQVFSPVKTKHEIKCESNEILVSDPMASFVNGAGSDCKARVKTEPLQCEGELKASCKNDVTVNDVQTQECDDLSQHYEIHKAGNRCKVIFTSKPVTVHSHKVTHWGIYSGDNSYSSSLFGKARTQPSNISNHQKSKSEERPFKCSQCGKCFSRAFALKVHERIHTGEKPYECTQCGRCFSVHSNLKQHQKIHTGEKPHICHQCGKCFVRETNLRLHQRVHSRGRPIPYVCNQCGECFADASSFSQHKRVHSVKKSYKHEQYWDAFSNISNIKQRKKAHADKKTYVCHHCGKRCDWQSNLKQHLASHSSEKTYKCARCGKCFKQSPSLSRHLRKSCSGNSCTASGGEAVNRFGI